MMSENACLVGHMRASGEVLHSVAQMSAQVVPARAQMATTLGFHIILACLGHRASRRSCCSPSSSA